jgi:predicted transcriptional regulator of viral defense system
VRDFVEHDRDHQARDQQKGELERLGHGVYVVAAIASLKCLRHSAT